MFTTWYSIQWLLGLGTCPRHTTCTYLFHYGGINKFGVCSIFRFELPPLWEILEKELAKLAKQGVTMGLVRTFNMYIHTCTTCLDR